MVNPRYRVLYVDDEPVLLEMGKIYLEKLNEFSVDTSTSAADVLKGENLSTYDAIISDFQMPGMNGIDFLKEVRSRFDNIPFILFTGRGREEIVIEALNSGADFYIQKGGDPSFQFIELMHKIKKSVSQRKAEKELLSVQGEIEERLREEKIISEFSQFLLNATSVEEVLDNFGSILFSESGADYLMLAKLDTAKNAVCIHSLKGLDPFLGQIGHLVKGIPGSLNVPMDVFKAQQDQFPLKIGLKKLDGGIFTLSRNYLSKPVCMAIEKLLKIKTIYVYELVWEGTLYGSVTFAFKQGNEIQNQPLVITMSDLLANGLFRIYSTNAISTEKQALAESEAKFRTIFENSPLPMSINAIKDGKFIAANAACLKYSGHTEAEFLGKTPLELGMLSIVNLGKLTSQMILTGKLENVPITVIRKGGDKIEVLVSVIPIRINDKPAVMTIAAEVSSLKKIEEELFQKNEELHAAYTELAATEKEVRKNYDKLRQKDHDLLASETRYSTLFENMLNALAYCKMEYDEAGNPRDWIYLEVNTAFVQLTGLEIVPGKRETDMIPSIRERYPELLTICGRVVKTGISEKFEIYFKLLEKWLNISVYRPEKECFIAVFEDITDHKKAEEALQQSNRKLNLLSGITRHDISNQLLALKGYLDISKEFLRDPGRTAEFIKTEEQIADTITHQISFTKDYEDLGVRAPAWQNISTLMKNVMDHLPVQNNTIRVDIPEIEVYADPLLEKVFYNLIDNAQRYGGEQMTGIHLTSFQNNGNHVICIEDDGTGISARDKPQLFTKGFGKHTGLGLYLSREILSITGITITENGEPGTGARFEIAVPKGMYRVVQESP